MPFTNKKFSIKLPKTLSYFYDKKKGVIIFKKKTKVFLLSTKIHLLINRNQNELIVTNIPLKNISNNEKKILKAIQGLTAAKIKLIFLELTETFYTKLKFVGIGYRAIKFKKLGFHGFFFKLGLSHSLYFNPVNNSLNIFCLKFTKLYVYGTSYLKICQTSASIRSYKLPEPYKGKGILYENEKIIRKEGKKI